MMAFWGRGSLTNGVSIPCEGGYQDEVKEFVGLVVGTTIPREADRRP
jgi:hypothetical protein